jgi:flagellar protein FlbD
MDQGRPAMIMITRLNGHEFALNCDLIERVEATPDTVITLIDGTKYVIEESVATVIELIRAYRSSVIVQADEHLLRTLSTRPRLQVVPDPEDD